MWCLDQELGHLSLHSLVTLLSPIPHKLLDTISVPISDHILGHIARAWLVHHLVLLLLLLHLLVVLALGPGALRRVHSGVHACMEVQVVSVVVVVDWEVREAYRFCCLFMNNVCIGSIRLSCTVFPLVSHLALFWAHWSHSMLVEVSRGYLM